jgi:hypothetical protein
MVKSKIIHKHLAKKHVTKKRVTNYNYKDFCIRKTIKTRDQSIAINIPKQYSKRLGWIGKENIKIRVLGQRLIISQVT